MKIGINGQYLTRENPAGPEKYTINLINALARIDNENEYLIYLETEPSEELLKNWSFASNFKYKVVPKIISWTQFGLGSELLINHVDVLYSPLHTVPGFAKILYPKTKFVSMIHGLEYKINKSFKGKPFHKLLHPLELWYVITFSNYLIVPSEFVKEEIIKEGWISSGSKKISVIPEGVNNLFHKYTAEEIERVKNQYKVNCEKYLFFVSTIQPRKNVPNMIEGFSKALKENENLKDVRLILVGKNGWQYEESIQAPEKFGVKENVMFLGRIPDKDVAVLMSGATALINISLEEGFGLPILESMASETPMILSDIKPYKELAKDYAIFAKPNDVESIKDGIVEMLSKGVEGKIIEEAKKQANDFTWEKTAERSLEVFKK